MTNIKAIWVTIQPSTMSKLKSLIPLYPILFALIETIGFNSRISG